MINKSYLTFRLHGLLLAVDTKVVKEIIWLPELTLIEECPPYIAGALNMHGKIVPVMDLSLRFGHSRQKYNISDRVIILDVSEFKAEVQSQQSLLPTSNYHIKFIGIIVNEVLDVMDIPDEDIELPPFDEKETGPPHFVRGAAKTGENIIMILNPRTILDLQFEIVESEIEKSEIKLQSSISCFCPEADREERKIFHSRAVNLQQIFDAGDSNRFIPAAVFRLNKEYLCIELESVREFSKIHNFTPVPCCPEHIAGNMNLRGNVLTMIDIRGLLNMQSGRISETTKVIVADTDGFPAGVIVDEILDVIDIREQDIVAVPSTIETANEKFIKGAVPYDSRIIAILNLNEILSWDGLIVNEEV